MTTQIYVKYLDSTNLRLKYYTFSSIEMIIDNLNSKILESIIYKYTSTKQERCRRDQNRFPNEESISIFFHSRMRLDFFSIDTNSSEYITKEKKQSIDFFIQNGFFKYDLQKIELKWDDTHDTRFFRWRRF